MVNIKLSGLDTFQKQLNEAQEAMKGLDGELATVRFDPNDPSSVDAAVRDMENAVDQKVSRYRNNALVKSLAEASKRAFEKRIRSRQQI